MLELDRTGVQHQSRRGRASVCRVAGYRRPGMGELHARLMGTSGLELEFEQRSLRAPVDHPDASHRVNRTSLAPGRHAHPSVSIGRQHVAKRRLT
jgi:hypothetical protein